MGHPCPFPTRLPATAIGVTDAALIADPFTGTGSTLVAAKELGRRAVGIEINESYCEIAAKRLETVQPELAA
jgi:DNA modification methylase